MEQHRDTSASKAKGAAPSPSPNVNGRQSHHDDLNPDPQSKNRITWRRPFDFTLTVVGYTVGIHDFWRFPYLCYKYGGVFFIPFWIVMLLCYIPGVFMEFTLGQYYALGSMQVFGELAPILTGVSFLLAWNSLTSCWLYAMYISWARLYSDDAASCKQGWRTCLQASYYNSEACYTGELDRLCEFQHIRALNKIKRATGVSPPYHADYQQLYYNFTCYSLTQFCDAFNSTPIIGTKSCRDRGTKKKYPVYSKRVHASAEYFYGGLCGLKKDNRRTRGQLTYKYTKDPSSASEDELFIFGFTTFAIIGYFLHEGLLAVSFITYLLNAAPFVALLYFTFLALALPYSLEGLQELSSFKGISALAEPAIWVDALIQVISCTGIGNGVLINLSTFNAKEKNYVYDTFVAALMNSFCSTCATVICFCAIGHTRILYKLQDVPFKEYVMPEATHSSLEFGYIVYTQFLSLIGDRAVPVLIFFFMMTSFSIDSALRLIQNSLDAVTFMFPRLRRHRLASLIAICLFGFAAILPMTRNGGVLLFWEYEYFLVKFVWPTMALIQTIGVTWIYKTGRMLDNAEEMGVINHLYFRRYLIVCLQYILPTYLMFVLGYNAWSHSSTKFIQHTDRKGWNDLFGYILTFLPLFIFLLSLVDQIAITPKGRRLATLFYPPARRKAIGRSLRRRTGLSITNYGAMSLHTNVKADLFKQPGRAIEKAINIWRKGGLKALRLRRTSMGIGKGAQKPVTQEEFDPEALDITVEEKDLLQHIYKAEGLGSPSDASSDDSLDDLLKTSYKELLGDMQREDEARYGKWRQVWKGIVKYLDKWPGRFDDEEDSSGESESSSSSSDDDEDMK